MMLVGFSALASAQQLDAGKSEFQRNCAACHGLDGKGGGPVGEELKSRPADLTVLSKKNNGVFPIVTVTDVIAGRRPYKAHGTREMPIWGYRYFPMPSLSMAPISPPLNPADLDAIYDPEIVVRNRILTIVDYLYRIQEK